MRRRSFVKHIAWLTGGLMLGNALPARAIIARGKKLRGRVIAGGKAIKGVVVSDGYTVVATDKKGQFAFEPHPDAVAVFISTPAGYAFTQENGIARHYRSLPDLKAGWGIDFNLEPLQADDGEHRFIVWADPQVKNAKDVEKMMKESVPDVQQLLAASAPGTLWHGITVGDMVWDELKLLADYDRAVHQMGIPFFQCLGNHDMDYRKGGDETSDDTFQQRYGPTYYSFNRGQVHYVVMDNVRYLGKEREYDGFFQHNQLEWLQKDLSFVPEDKLIVLCVHIPVHSGTKNREELYAILKDRPVHIMSGHTHYHVNAIRENIYEHNHGTVCGAWWTGPICADGTPCGYGVYTVKGEEISWHYQSTGMPAQHQMKLYLNEADASQKQLTVNIWNHDPAWKTEYRVDGLSQGPLEAFESFDPLAYSSLLGPALPKARGFAEPRKTNHLFRALVPASAKEIEVLATDRFGNRFSENIKLLA